MMVGCMGAKRRWFREVVIYQQIGKDFFNMVWPHSYILDETLVLAVGLIF